MNFHSTPPPLAPSRRRARLVALRPTDCACGHQRAPALMAMAGAHRPQRSPQRTTGLFSRGGRRSDFVSYPFMNRRPLSLFIALLFTPTALSAAAPAFRYPPSLDLSRDTARHVVIAQGTAETYQGHPTTLLLPDGRTMFCVWTINHGGPCGPFARSDDGGRTWSLVRDVPANWKTTRNCPALYRLTDPRGVARLFIYAGTGPGGDMHAAHSLDERRRGRR